MNGVYYLSAVVNPLMEDSHDAKDDWWFERKDRMLYATRDPKDCMAALRILEYDIQVREDDEYIPCDR